MGAPFANLQRFPLASPGETSEDAVAMPTHARPYRPPMNSRAAVVLAALACTLALPASASAFCRTTTVKVDAGYMPPPNACWDKGIPLFWRSACVGYSLQRDGSRQVAFADASRLTALAFTRWTSATCDTEVDGSSRVSIDVRDLGPVSCTEVRYNQSQTGLGNANIIVFRDDAWPHDDTANTLAITTVSYNPKTGEIYDADLEINTAQQPVTVSDPVPKNGYDLQSILTHETGHFFGLAHSGDAHATMYARYQQGLTAMRKLTADDVRGICTVYPPGNLRAVDAVVSAGGTVPAGVCDPTPRGGFITECGTPKSKGCATAPARRSPGAGGLCALGVGLALLAARRSLRGRK